MRLFGQRISAHVQQDSPSRVPLVLSGPLAELAAAGLVAVKERVNAIALAPVDDFRRDSNLFGASARSQEVQTRLQAAFESGLQRRDAEMDWNRLLGDLAAR